MYIQSPLNYIGGKYKLLPQILPLFPRDIDTFVDLFTGGCNVGVNVEASRIICNDTIPQLIEFLIACKSRSSSEMLYFIDSIIEEYDLSKTNREGYLKLREAYNNNEKYRGWSTFYALVCHSFNNKIRFNSKGEFNQPFGKDRSSFNPKLREKFTQFVDKMKALNIHFLNLDFEFVRGLNLKCNDFVYADPPYYGTSTPYNDNGGWTEKEENRLYEVLDDLNNRNIKFALSNVTIHRGKENEMLKAWSSKYNIHNLRYSYSNCNYHIKDRTSLTQEVLITNY